MLNNNSFETVSSIWFIDIRKIRCPGSCKYFRPVFMMSRVSVHISNSDFNIMKVMDKTQ